MSDWETETIASLETASTITVCAQEDYDWDAQARQHNPARRNSVSAPSQERELACSSSTLSLHSAQGRAQFAKHGIDTVIDLVIKEEKWSDGANDEEDVYPGVVSYLDTVFSELFDYILR